MKGQVTKQHIKNGEPNNCNWCPIALSLMDKLDIDDVEVNETQVRVGKKWYDIRRGTRFIQRFDMGLPVKPMTYELSPA